MPNNNLDYLNQDEAKKGDFKKLIANLTWSQKISIFLIVVVVIISIVVLVRLNSKTEYSVLFTNIDPADAAVITQNLDDAAILYTLSDDGRTVSVEKSKLADARLTLAADGIPFNSVVGFELFDRQFFGLTDFTQKVNYQRAIEGELSRTIAGIDEVESARVHIVLPKDDLFVDEKSYATASIILKIAQGSQINPDNVRAITNLVVNSVGELNEENVSIVDTNGNLLSSGGESSALLTDQQKIVAEYEKNTEENITSMLLKLFGPGNVIVKVNADINFDKKEAEIETFMPDEEGNGVILSEAKMLEQYDKVSDENINAGAAGTDANVPAIDEDGEFGVPVYAEEEENNQKDKNSYIKDESQTQYGVSRKIERIVSGGGEIERMTVGIFINSQLTNTEIRDIESVVSAASGVDTERGDLISIKGVNFASLETPFNIEEEQSIGQTGILSNLKSYIPAALLLIMLLFLTLRVFLSGGKDKKKKQLEARENLVNQRLKAKAAEKELMSSRKAEEEINDADLIPDIPEDKLAKLKRLVGEGVETNPEVARKIIKNWIGD
jgi:flagellar M-ring protein FliF